MPRITDPDAFLAALQQHDGDWRVRWLMNNADGELWAPRQFLIVTELLKGSPRLMTIWQAVYRLWVLYRPSGQTRFSLRQIADAAGVSLQGLADDLRRLHGLRLLVIGDIDANPGHPHRRRPWSYHVDTDWLQEMSTRLVVSRIAPGQKIRRRAPDGQLRLMEQVGDDAIIEMPSRKEECTMPAADTPLSAAGTGKNVVQGHGAANQQPYDTTSATFLREHTVISAAYPGSNTGQVYAAAAPASVFSPSNTGEPVPNPVIPGRNTPVTEVLLGSNTHRDPVLPGSNTAPASADGMLPGSNTAAPVLPGSNTTHGPVLPGSNTSGAAVLPGSNTAPASADGMLPGSNAVWMIEREIERKKEREGAQQARSAAAVAPTPPSDDLAERINRTIEQRLPALIEQLSAGLLRQIAHVAPPSAPVAPPEYPLAGDIPAAPPGEPPLREPLLVIWQKITGAPASPRDEMQIAQLVDRYETGLAGKFSAYWVGRVMLYADALRTDPTKRIDIKNINTFLARMEREARCFSTASLEDPGYGKTNGATPASAPRTTREKAPAAAQEPDRPAPTHTSAPPEDSEAQKSAQPVNDAPHPGDVHDPVAIWRSFAGSKRGISPAREAALRAIVTDPALWRIVLTNFGERYAEKANWANWDALLDHYRREASVGTSAVAGIDPRMSVIPATILYHHPVLAEDMELRRVWIYRYHDAPTKSAKQEVLRRLVQEHPLPDPLPTELAECLGLAAPVSGGAP
jgi:hypothetical protein